MIIVVVTLAVAILYLLAIMPRMINRPDYTPLMGHFYAHRGLHDNKTDAPENSLAAFKKAVEAGYGIELDVQLAKDGTAVVFHDESLDRACGIAGKVSDFTFSELREMRLFRSYEKIPSLAEVLGAVGGKVPLIVEIKMHTSATDVCRRADDLLRLYRGVYCIESFHPAALLWYKKRRPRVVRGQLSSNFSKEAVNYSLSHFIVRHLLSNFITKPDFIAYRHEYKNALSRRLCRQLYRCLSVAWTVRSQQQLDNCKNDFDLFIFEGFKPRQSKAEK